MNNQIVPDTVTENSFVTIEGGFKDLSPEMIMKSIGNIQKEMMDVPKEHALALETLHTFADGLYTRSVLMKAGSLVVGKIHKLEHIVVIGKGSARVISPEFGSRVIFAPNVFVSPPLVKRLLFVQEDMIWTTVHKNPENIRDLNVLEDILIEQEEDSCPG